MNWKKDWVSLQTRSVTLLVEMKAGDEEALKQILVPPEKYLPESTHQSSSPKELIDLPSIWNCWSEP
jgi:hypothetical protein